MDDKVLFTQQEPQLPWSLISLRLGHSGQFVLPSKFRGSGSLVRCTSSLFLRGGSMYCDPGRTPIRRRMLERGNRGWKLRPAWLRKMSSLQKLTFKVSRHRQTKSLAITS